MITLRAMLLPATLGFDTSKLSGSRQTRTELLCRIADDRSIWNEVHQSFLRRRRMAKGRKYVKEKNMPDATNMIPE